MKTKKALIVLVSFLLLITTVIAIMHVTSRQKIPEGSLAVNYQEKTLYADFNTLPLQAVKGTVINGKGEVKQVDTMGIEVSRLLESLGINPTGFSTIAFVADDEFSAAVTAEEITQSNKVFLSKEDDSFTLTVFGDKDSKRNVRKVVRLDIA